MNNIKIENANINDIDSILDIIYKRCLWLNAKNIHQWPLDYYPDRYNKEYFIEELEKDYLFVARDKDLVVGVILLKKEDPRYWENDGKSLYIHHFSTQDGYKGLGKLLLEYSIDFAIKNNFSYLKLDCVKNNERLNEYYINFGFKLIKSGVIGTYEYNLLEKKLID